MGILVGFHVEGWDHLIFRALLARILNVEEGCIVPDIVEASSGRGWAFVLELLPKALHRFYGKCAQLAVVGIDNDGNVDLTATGQLEDPKHPRHWNHPEAPLEACRWCELATVVTALRTDLHWLRQKPGDKWPILLAVPVEAVEAWLLVSQAIIRPGSGSLRAESSPRYTLKQQFYGAPEATRTSVETKALPMIREMQTDHIQALALHSKSFAQFLGQIDIHRSQILGAVNCYAPGDGASQR